MQVALRRAGDKLERRYRGNLSAHASALLLRADDGGRAALRRSLAVVREELFRDGVNWGRIVAMMELGGALSAEAGGAGQVDDIARWMEESLDSAPLQGWIEDNGGWVGRQQLTLFFPHFLPSFLPPPSCPYLPERFQGSLKQFRGA